ncbi:helicase RepA family protein [Tranquillimonas alkanivorans]|uniref:helicase RepA family protein n=1 Tax=Tranquillimonas alkanivorans TaxID=441119 RepID=UPI001C4314D4|nr:helicase RepA family protein [Tranquillimonas alkanivorans]
MLFVHHCGKDEARGARRTSALKAAVDTKLRLQIWGGAVLATVEKQRTMPKSAKFSFGTGPVPLGLDEDDEPYTTVKIVPKEAPAESAGTAAKGSRKEARRTALLAVLTTRRTSVRRIAASRSSRCWATSRTARSRVSRPAAGKRSCGIC